MSKENDGGPAFPRPVSVTPPYDVTEWAQDGMSLRDYFAGQALAAVHVHGYMIGDSTADDVAMSAYRIADRMLAAREQ